MLDKQQISERQPGANRPNAQKSRPGSTIERIFLIACAVASATGQTKVDLRTQGESVDFSGMSATSPVQTGTALPAACSPGQLYFKTDAPTGANLFFCAPANQWSAGTGVQSVSILSDGTLVGVEGSVNFQAGTGIAELMSDTGSRINIRQSVDTSVIQTKPGTQGGNSVLCSSQNSSGSADFSCAMTPTLSAFTLGMVLNWLPNVSGPAGGITLNVDTLGAVPVKKADGSSDPSASDIAGGSLYPIWYDGTVFRLASGSVSSGSTLAASVVQSNQSNTFTAGDQNFTNASSLEIPVAAGAVATADGRIAYDSTNRNLHARTDGADGIVGVFASAPVNGNCIKASVASNAVQLADAGMACGASATAFVPSVFYQAQMLPNVTVTAANTLIAQTATLPAMPAGYCYAYYFELYPASGTWTNSQPRIWYGTAPGMTGDQLQLTSPAGSSTGPYQGSGRICNNNGSQTVQTFTGYPVFTQISGAFGLVAAGTQTASSTGLRIGLTADSNGGSFSVVPIEFRVWSEGW